MVTQAPRHSGADTGGRFGAQPELVVRRVLADQVQQHVLTGISNGQFPAGTRIVETSLARELGVSQAPVREALRGLQAIGMVEIEPYRGATVRVPDPVTLQEAYDVRSALESLGMSQAFADITPAVLDRLADLRGQMGRAAEDGDRRRVAELDVRFHATIMELSGNATLLRVWRSLEPLSRTYFTLIMPNADPNWTAGLHDPILTALRTGDKRASIRALREHFNAAAAKVRSNYEARSH